MSAWSDSMTLEVTDANRELALATWAQVSFADGLPGRAGYQASRKANRMLAELFGDAYVKWVPLNQWFEVLDRVVGLGPYREDASVDIQPTESV